MLKIKNPIAPLRKNEETMYNERKKPRVSKKTKKNTKKGCRK